MIEKELQDRMWAAVADEPPLGFDPDELVDRAGRQQRRRRSTFAAAAATGAVLAVAVLVAGMPGQGTQVGTTATTTPTVPTVPTVPTTTSPPNPECVRVEELNTVPPLNFAGSAAIVARLDEATPRLIARHLPGVSVEPSETGMIAYDCPPNVGTLYPVRGVDQSVMVYLIHETDRRDLANDRYAEDRNYQLAGEDTAADGALVRTYEYTGTIGDGLVVVRFGADGMITEASVSGQGTLVADRAVLTALASDPELRF